MKILSGVPLPLPRTFYNHPAEHLARALLGQRLTRIIHGIRCSGIIIETEAYTGIDDAASHAFRGRRSPKNESMYARPGTAYVYFTYGMHHCFNVACEAIDIPAAVLIRALEPIEGLDEMTSRRGPQAPAKSQPSAARTKTPKSTAPISRRSAAPPSTPSPASPRALTKSAARFLCGGPGKLCAALAIDRTLDGLDLCTSPIIRIEPGETIPDNLIARSPRIGIGERGEWSRRELRFFIRNHPGVSR